MPAPTIPEGARSRRLVSPSGKEQRLEKIGYETFGFFAAERSALVARVSRPPVVGCTYERRPAGPLRPTHLVTCPNRVYRLLLVKTGGIKIL